MRDRSKWEEVMHRVTRSGIACLLAVLFTVTIVGQTPTPQAHNAAAKPEARPARPKLVVMIVVDQMRGDYVDKFRAEWSGALKGLLNEGAWFPDSAYPYPPTDTCVAHSTLSTVS